MGKQMLPVEERIRSAFRVCVMVGAIILGLWVLLAGNSGHHRGPGLTPCPPQECVLHPHAPHGPGG